MPHLTGLKLYYVGKAFIETSAVTKETLSTKLDINDILVIDQ